MAINHLPFSRNVDRIDFINSLSGGTSPSCFFAFTRTSNKTIDMIHKTGIAQNGKNHTMAARADPKIGLSTFPNVLDVSIIPKPVLTCFRLCINHQHTV